MIDQDTLEFVLDFLCQTYKLSTFTVEDLYLEFGGQMHSVYIQQCFQHLVDIGFLDFQPSTSTYNVFSLGLDQLIPF